MSVIRLRAAFALCCLFAFAGAPVFGQAGKVEPRKVIVTANATTHVKPNAVRLSFVVTSQTQGNVRDDNDRQVAKVKKALADLALVNLDMQVVPAAITSVQMTERQVARFGGGGPGGGPAGGPIGAVPAVPVKTQQIQTLVVVTLRDKDLERLSSNVSKIADVVVDHGGIAPSDENSPGYRGTRILGAAYSESFPGPRIDWLAENAGEARQQAIKRAVKDAMENARAAVGDQANLQVAAIEISAPEDHGAVRRFRADVQPPETGLIPITVEVKVTFAY
jgi:uncharacterized protein YggE